MRYILCDSMPVRRGLRCSYRYGGEHLVFAPTARHVAVTARAQRRCYLMRDQPPRVGILTAVGSGMRVGAKCADCFHRSDNPIVARITPLPCAWAGIYCSC